MWSSDANFQSQALSGASPQLDTAHRFGQCHLGLHHFDTGSCSMERIVFGFKDWGCSHSNHQHFDRNKLRIDFAYFSVDYTLLGRDHSKIRDGLKLFA